MPLLSITPVSNRILKDCFKSSVEYTFVSTEGDDGETVGKKMKVLHDVFHLEAYLIWRSSFEELASDKNWDAADKFRNAAILLSGEAKDKWMSAKASKVPVGAALTDALWTDTLKEFTKEFCTKSDTEKVREMLQSARKPSSMTIRDFVARVKQLNRYLPYLPSPLNAKLPEDEIQLIIRRSVPDWNESLVRSAQSLETVQELTSYYQDLEDLENRRRHKTSRNDNQQSKRRGNNYKSSNNSGQRDRNREIRMANERNDSNQTRRNDGNRHQRNQRDREGDDDDQTRHDRSRSQRNNQPQRNNNYNNNNQNPTQHRYNLRPRNRREEHRRLENNDDDDNSSVSTHGSVGSHRTQRTMQTNRSERSRRSTSSYSTRSSRHEVYLADKDTPPTKSDQPDYRPEVVVRVIRDLVTKRYKVIRALIDTGSSRTIVRSRILPVNKNKDQLIEREYDTFGGVFRTTRETELAFQLVQFSPHRTITHDVSVVEESSGDIPDNTPDMVIGRDLIRDLKLQLNFSADPPMIVWEDSSVPITPRGFWNKTRIQELFSASLIDEAERCFEDKSPSMLAANYQTTDVETFVPQHLSPTEQDKLKQLLLRFKVLFDGKLGELPSAPVELKLKDPSIKPYHGRAYPVPKIHEKLLRNEVDRLVNIGVLQRCNQSDWAAPSFGIPKKNGQIRFVSDFRHLNRHLQRMPFPLPVTQELFRTMDGFNFVSVLDLNMGFWTIRLSPPSQKLCTIILPWGKYCYLRLPMGLSVSPDIYQERMSLIFADLEYVIVYMDDICIITKGSFSDHLHMLTEVFKRIRRNNLQINGPKSKFFAHETEFLGFVLSREGIRPQQKKLEAIYALKPPTTPSQVRSILGLVNYYKQFIPHRSHTLAPLTQLTKKNVKFHWSPQCQAALDSIKNVFARKITLAFPDFSKPFEIYTDASGTQLGSVIQQAGRPLAFYSRRLTDAQTRYTVTELELLSIVETLQEYRTILLGHHIQIFTDHRNLTFTNFTTDRVRRWRLIVEEYGPEIIYIQGKKNIVADMLSRYPRQGLIPDEIHLVEALHTTDDNFPLSYDVLSSAQQQDSHLCRIARSNTRDYTTQYHARLPIIYYGDKIVVPVSLQPRLLQWYHSTLLHPGIQRTLKTIAQHFHWKSLTTDVTNHVANCSICQQAKKFTTKYGILPTKTHDPHPWSTVHVDLAGPWKLPTSTPASISELLVLTIMDPDTTFCELTAIPNKSSLTVAHAFDRIWLCRYPRPLYCVHDSGTEFTGIEFQELLSSYGIKSRPITVNNPQANAVLERAHQTMANQIRTLTNEPAPLHTIADLQQFICSPVQWALNSTFHTTLQATPGQLAFARDMIFPTSFLANWERIRQMRQHNTDVSTARENHSRIPHTYHSGDLVLVTPIGTQGKLAKPTLGPFTILDTSQQSINGTVTIQRNRAVERINIRRLRPYTPSS